jgi:hypothetical protein
MHVELRAICPRCESISLRGRVDPKFYVNAEKNVGYCHHCGFKGQMTEELIDNLNVVSLSERRAFDSKVWERDYGALSPTAYLYLEKRFPGVPQAELDAFQLRYSEAHHAIAIPTFNAQTATLQGIKLRYIAPLNDQRYGAEDSSQFGGFWLHGKKDKLLIVEGEFDAMTAKLAGFEGTVLALQTNKLSKESLQQTRSFKHAFYCLDNDAAGSVGTLALLRQQTQGFDIPLPSGVKDLNELFQQKGRNETSRFLQSQTQTAIEKATTEFSTCIPEMLAFLSDTQNTRGTSTGYRSLDQLLGGGLRPAEVTVINAFAKTGKTSFLNNLAHNLALAGKKVALASFEMPPATTLYPSILSIASQTNIRQMSKEQLGPSIHAIHEECSYIDNIITLKQFGYTPWSEIEEWAKAVQEKYKIEFLFLDHAGFMVEKMTDAEENQTLAKSISKLSKSTGLHIPIVVQAPKTKDGLSIQTAYGGLAWAMNADNFIILERSKENEEQLKVRLEASRYPGANPSHTPAILFYDRETCTLTE